MRFRNIGLIGGTLALLAYTTVSFPGAHSLEEYIIFLIAIIAKLAMPVVAVLFAFLGRKALLDYKGFDLSEYLEKAKETATGAGLAFLGVCILMYALLGLFGNQVNAQPVTTYIPERAFTYLPTLKLEQERLWADHPKPMCSVVLSSTNPALA